MAPVTMERDITGTLTVLAVLILVLVTSGLGETVFIGPPFPRFQVTTGGH